MTLGSEPQFTVRLFILSDGINLKDKRCWYSNARETTTRLVLLWDAITGNWGFKVIVPPLWPSAKVNIPSTFRGYCQGSSFSSCAADHRRRPVNLEHIATVVAAVAVVAVVVAVAAATDQGALARRGGGGDATRTAATL